MSWGVWGGGLEREGSGEGGGGRGMVGRKGAAIKASGMGMGMGNPFRALEERRGFLDVRVCLLYVSLGFWGVCGGLGAVVWWEEGMGLQSGRRGGRGEKGGGGAEERMDDGTCWLTFVLREI